MRQYEELSDAALWLLLNGGEAEAYDAIFRRYHGVLYRHAHRLLDDADTAHDVVQEVFKYLWQHRQYLEFHSSLSGYLYRMLRNGVLNEIKRSDRQARHIEAFSQYLQKAAPPADESIRSRQLHQIIEQEIENLPPRMREVFRLRREEQLTYKEIAERLGISGLTVKTQLNKAVKLLKKRLLSFFLLFF